MSRSRNLYALQQIDSRLDQYQKRSHEIARILADNSAVKQAQAQADKAQRILAEAQKELRSAETKVKNQRIKIGQNEANLYSGKIRNPKELQSLQDEVAALKRFLSILEDRQLEAMLHVDDMAEKNDAAQAALSTAQKAAQKLNSNLTAEKEKIEADKARLMAKRESSLPSIAPDDLKNYDQLRKQRAGVAVSKVNDRACFACGVRSTP